ncbi:HD-GYP domain-containing protein [Elusimicrobiota bacterium]
MRFFDIFKKTKSEKSIPKKFEQNSKIAQNITPFHNIPDYARNKESALFAEELYAKALSEIKLISNNTISNISCDKEIFSIPEIIKLVKNGNSDILALAYLSTKYVYFYGHCVNVCIFSIFLGHGLGLSDAKLEVLGLCAMLHDIGMIKVMNIALKKSKLKQKEREELSKHKQYGQEILKSLLFIPDETRKFLTDLMDEIELYKKDPTLVKSSRQSDLYKFSRIIAICNIYEAITHPRVFRERFLPYHALKTWQVTTQSQIEDQSLSAHSALRKMISSSKHDFDSEIVKVFINKISLYPPGSYVRLNTDEIARVIETNAGMPTRPIVRLVLDKNSQRPLDFRVDDLSNNKMLFIKEAVDETNLNVSDSCIMQELSESRWWNKNIN